MQFNRIFPKFLKLTSDFIKDYPDAKEEMDPDFPTPFGPLMQSTFLVDYDHSHDLKLRCSITGLIDYVGSTPVIWYYKRQGSIDSSTYSAEFSALLTVAEESQSIRYMLCCLGCNVPSDGSCPTRIFGNNLISILNSQNPAADLSNKHVAIFFNVIREAVASSIIEPY